ncbi:MAG TPA: sulfotransferase [Candidatus Sulfotelmatobacter sp.]
MQPEKVKVDQNKDIEAIVKTSADMATVTGNEFVSAKRNKAPVFVLGCPRSGTTVLYHMLLSAGDFAVYRAESNVFNLLVPRFRGMRSTADRRKLLETWLRSKLFRVSGLDAREISDKIMAECRGGGDFLRIVMEEVARQQGTGRWADCTPDHLLYMEEIKRQIPDALFIHIIRDGRDVALSYVQQGWSYPLPWDRDERLGVAGLYWEWVVRKGQEQGRRLGADYQEVRFEELIMNRRQTLSRLGAFIEHDLDYERIQCAGIGSVSQPNTSFAAAPEEDFHPIGRWKTKMSGGQTAAFEELVGDFLQELRYFPGSEAGRRMSLRASRLRTTYRTIFEAKYWMKATPLGRFVGLEPLEIERKAVG